MKATIIVLGTDDLDIARTLDSIRDADLPTEVQTLTRPPSATAPWSNTTDEFVVLMHAGDRICARGMTALLSGLDEADVVVGGYRIAGAGHWGVEVTPPRVDTIADLAAWAVAPPFELSAIAVRRSVLPSASHPAPGQSGGEISLLCAALASHPSARIVAIDDIVAEVRIRPVHAGDPTAMLDRLRGVLEGPLGDDPITASRVRRRALSLAYLESTPLVAGQFDADCWWGPAVEVPAARAVLRDLHWVLTCLADARKMAELGLDGIANSAPSDAIADMPPDDANMQATIGSFHVMVGELTDTVGWLHAEVRERDERLAVTESLHQLIGELNNTITWLHGEVRLRDEQLLMIQHGAT